MKKAKQEKEKKLQPNEWSEIKWTQKIVVHAARIHNQLARWYFVETNMYSFFIVVAILAVGVYSFDTPLDVSSKCNSVLFVLHIKIPHARAMFLTPQFLRNQSLYYPSIMSHHHYRRRRRRHPWQQCVEWISWAKNFSNPNIRNWAHPTRNLLAVI